VPRACGPIAWRLRRDGRGLGWIALIGFLRGGRFGGGPGLAEVGGGRSESRGGQWVGRGSPRAGRAEEEPSVKLHGVMFLDGAEDAVGGGARADQVCA